MNKKPETYQEWRYIYQGTAMWLGVLTYRDILKNKSSVIRLSWQLAYRLERIRKRLDVEVKAHTKSWLEALAEAVVKEIIKGS